MPRPAPAAPRPGSQRARLVSSIAILLLAAGSVLFYSVRRAAQLFDLGIDAHAQCAVAADTNQRLPHSDLADALGPQLAAVGGGTALVAAGTCSAAGRDYTDVVLRKEKALISVSLTHRSDQEVFPRLFAGQVTNGIHVTDRRGYALAAFESGPYLAYVASNLPTDRNEQLASLYLPVINRIATQ